MKIINVFLFAGVMHVPQCFFFFFPLKNSFIEIRQEGEKLQHKSAIAMKVFVSVLSQVL